MKTIHHSNLEQKKILVRVDLNVPVSSGIITEKSRIKSIGSTIKKLIKGKNKIFLISHFGRPKGIYNKKYSLEFICSHLVEELKINKIHFIKNFKNNIIKKKIQQIEFGDVCLFENIRFEPREEINDLNFAKELSMHFDFFINDAFSASHRLHASIVGIPQFLPSLAGYAFLNEIQNIEKFIKKPKKPNVAIIGGSKISTKIDVLYNLSNFFDTIIIGGAMANTFLHAKKINIGRSLYEKNLTIVVHKILNKAKKFNCKIILPVDVVCADSLTDKLNIRQCNIKNIHSHQMVFDVGEKTIKLINKYLLDARMILWNGPLGAFENSPFNYSSFEIAKFIKDKNKKLNKVALAGGGDTISVIKNAKAEKSFSYLSKAGGAFLEWLEGEESPGFKALKNQNIN